MEGVKSNSGQATKAPDKSKSTAESNTAAADLELSSTLEAFNSRMRQRKLERQIKDGESEKAAKARQALLLEAMTSLRRSLADVARIDLGDRFSFNLETDDWGGWPRLQLLLSDSLVPEAEYPIFQVTANDRQQCGCLEIIYGLQGHVERVTIPNREQLKYLAQVVKRCIRIYLDIVEKTICEAELSEVEESERQNLAAVEAEETEATRQDRITGDLFEDETYQQDFLEKLPELDELDALPEFSAEPLGAKSE